MQLRSLLLAAVVLGGCSSPSPGPAEAVIPRAGRVGSSIAVVGQGSVVAVASADQGEVTLVDAETLSPIAHVAVGEEPRALLPSKSGGLWVTTHRGGELLDVDTTSGTISRRIAVCAGAFGLSESPDGSFVAVACESEGTVVVVDAATLSSRVVARGLSRPRAVVALDDGAMVAGFTGGTVTRIRFASGANSVSLVPQTAPERPALTLMTANLASALLVVDGRVWVAHQLVNHTGDKSSEVVADDYGSITDGNPKINPSVTALRLTADGIARDDTVTPLYASFLDTDLAFSGPSALAAIDATHLLVAHVTSGDVAILDLASSSSRVVGSVVTGSGARGVAVDPASHRAFVDNAFDGSISRIELSSLAGRRDADETRVLGLPAVYSPEALVGRRLFHDARNRHLTPAGVVACATCHPDGGDDGLVWFIHTARTALKRRRTPHLANATSADGPYHWNGEFVTIAELTNATVTDLMAGDGLLVDAPSVSAYLDEIVRAPVPPAGDPTRIAQGAELFASTGCSTCHASPDLTDGKMHSPLSPMSLATDDVFPESKTPALRGLFLRAPYFHDGRATDLADLLTRADASAHSGTAAALAEPDLTALIAYLSSL